MKNILLAILLVFGVGSNTELRKYNEIVIAADERGETWMCLNLSASSAQIRG